MGFKRKDIIDIMLNFEGKSNVDGTGFVYLKNGQFCIQKWGRSLSSLIKSNTPMLQDVPDDTWVLGHLRAASHGAVSYRNAHPFKFGEYCGVHNGIFSEYLIPKLVMQQTINFKSDTDSEVAFQILNKIGPKSFLENIESSGVFMALHKSGRLDVIKTSGDLEVFHRTNGTVLLASELDKAKYKRKYEAEEGWYRYDKNGKYVKHLLKYDEEEKEAFWKKYMGQGYPSGPYSPYVSPYVPAYTPTAITRHLEPTDDEVELEIKGNQSMTRDYYYGGD